MPSLMDDDLDSALETELPTGGWMKKRLSRGSIGTFEGGEYRPVTPSLNAPMVTPSLAQEQFKNFAFAGLRASLCGDD